MKTFIVTLLLILSQLSLAANTVYIATNREQPPYTINNGEGLVADLVNALNAMQFDYKFEIAEVVSDRAKAGLTNGTYDMVAMSNIMWGYQGLDAQASINLIDVKDQYFALATKATDQSYFDKLGTKAANTTVVRGFSYNFLGFEKDVGILKSQFNTAVVLDEPTVIKMVLSGRSDIGVSSSTNLEYFKILDANNAAKLVVADKVDSEYQRHFVVSNSSSISVDEFNALLKKLSEDGTLSKIFARYGLTPAL